MTALLAESRPENHDDSLAATILTSTKAHGQYHLG
jgi:hypothetical protein